jgi:O-antigen ligase/polysaccharide polymerase Wzy-like membrane protein
MTTLPATHQQRNSPPVVFPSLVIGASLAILAALAVGVSVYVAAVPYAIGFMALVYVRPDLAFGLILATAPFNYDVGLGGANIALSDVSVVLALPVLLLRVNSPITRFLQIPTLPGVVTYLSVCLLSIAFNGDVTDGITSMVQMVLYLIVAVFVFSICIESRLLLLSGLYGLVISCTFLAVVKLGSQSLFVLGLHKNSIGASLSYGVIAATELWIISRGRARRVLIVVLCILMAGLLATLSRGAWVGALGGVMLIFGLRRQFLILARMALVTVPVLTICWALLPAQAREVATDISSHASGSVDTRLKSIEYAYSLFESHAIFGAGVGLRKAYDATNLVMSTLAETGVVGLATFVMIYALFAKAVFRARQAIQVNDPLFPFLAIGSGLVLCEFLHGLVDHFWSRGCLPAWAGMGMAIYVCDAVRNRSAGGRQLVRR